MRKEEIRAILQLPRELMKDIREIDLQIDEYNHAFLHSPAYSHMPKCRTGVHHDISERVASMEELISAKKEVELDYAAACDRSMELIAKIPIVAKDEWQDASAAVLKQLKGVHNLFVTMPDGVLMHVDWVQFK